MGVLSDSTNPYSCITILHLFLVLKRVLSLFDISQKKLRSQQILQLSKFYLGDIHTTVFSPTKLSNLRLGLFLKMVRPLLCNSGYKVHYEFVIILRALTILHCSHDILYTHIYVYNILKFTNLYILYFYEIKQFFIAFYSQKVDTIF